MDRSHVRGYCLAKPGAWIDQPWEGDEVVKGQYVIEAISQLAPKDAIIATGVGQHQMWAAQFYRFTQPRSWLTSGGLGTMGYCLPAAIGAQVAFPQRIHRCASEPGI